MKLETIQDVFEAELFDMYSAETQLTKALPKMAKNSTSADLAEAFVSHLQETEGQLARLDKIFTLLNIKPEKETCKAMKGLVDEAEHMIKQAEKGPVMDAMLITLAQKVEHYEMASYGSLRALATQLGYDEVAELISETYDEEQGADEKLTELAQNHINDDAILRRAA